MRYRAQGVHQICLYSGCSVQGGATPAGRLPVGERALEKQEDAYLAGG